MPPEGAVPPPEREPPPAESAPKPRRRLRERLPARPRIPGRRTGGAKRDGRTLGQRVGSVAAKVRDGLGDLLYVVGRGFAAIGGAFAALGERLRKLWFGLSLHTRQRVAAVLAVAVVAAVIWFAAVPNLPCQLPAGDACPPADDAAEIVPGDALAYAHANVDPETEQYAAATALGARLPTLSGQLLSLLGTPLALPVDFEQRVRPWLAGEIVFAVVPGEGGRPERVLLFEVDDPEGAQAYVEQTASGPLSESDYEGVTVRIDQRGTASALAGDFLVVGAEVAVQRTIDAERGAGRTLASSPLETQVLDELPDDSVAKVAVSEDGVSELLAGRRGPLGSFEPFVNFDATVGAGAALIADDDAFELAVHSQLDPERLESSPGFFDVFPPFDPTLAEDLDAKTLAYLGLGDPAASIEGLFTQAIAEAPGVATGFNELIDDLQRSGKVDLQSELLPLLEGEAALSIEPAGPGEAADGQAESEAPAIPGEDVGPPDDPGAPAPEDLLPPEEAPPAPGVVSPTGVPYLLFVAEDVDEVRAQETLAKLQGPLAEALDPAESLQAPVFTNREIEGVEAHSLRLSRTVDLTYAVFDGKLVVASDPQGVAEVKSGEGGLVDTPPYERSTEDLPEEPSFLIFLNLTQLIALAEQAGLSDDTNYAPFATDVRRLNGLGLAVERGDETLDSTLRLTVGG